MAEVVWLEVTDPNSGNTFYSNPQTGECLWNVPKGQTFECKPELTQWWELHDPTHGRSYFYNTESGETSWTRPKGITPVRLPEGFGRDGDEEDEEDDEEYESEVESDADFDVESGVQPYNEEELQTKVPEEEEAAERESDGEGGEEKERGGEKDDDDDEEEEEDEEEENDDEEEDIGEEKESEQEEQLHKEVNSPEHKPAPSVVVDIQSSEPGTQIEHEVESGNDAVLPAVAPISAATGEAQEVSDNPIGQDPVKGATIPLPVNHHIPVDLRDIDRRRASVCVASIPEPISIMLAKEEEKKAKKAETASIRESVLEGRLPPGWFEFEDASTGRKYYGHPESGTTQWQRPVISPSISRSVSDGESDIARVPSVVEIDDDDDEQDVEDLPEDDDDGTTSTTGQEVADSDSAELEDPAKKHPLTKSSPAVLDTLLQKKEPVDKSLKKVKANSLRNSMPVVSGNMKKNLTADEKRLSMKMEKLKKKKRSNTDTTALATSAEVDAPPFHPDLMEDINKFQLEGYAKKYFEQHKKGVFRRVIPIREMLAWSKEPLPTSLVKLGSEKLAKDAMKLFKLVQIYMGDRPSKKGEIEIAIEIMSKCISTPELRDEFFCQVCKQTCFNPSRSFKGWDLFVLGVLTFPPTRNLEEWLKNYWEEHLKLPTKEREYAIFCLKKLPKICSVGARGRIPTADEIRKSIDSPFRNTNFGVTIEEIMERQAETHPDVELPLILTTLSEAIFRLNGHKTEGIFRVPGDAEEVNKLRLQIDMGDYSTSYVEDPNTPGSLLKLWLRELEEPLIPNEHYESCIKNCNEGENAMQVMEQLPTHNKAIAKYVVRMLQTVGKDSEINKMSTSNLAMVFAPNFLRCPDPNPQVIFENTKFEKEWLHTLIQNLPPSD